MVFFGRSITRQTGGVSPRQRAWLLQIPRESNDASTKTLALADGSRDHRHGDHDRGPGAEALKKAGAKDVTFLKVEGAGHGVFTQHTDETGPAMEAFFARTLNPSHAGPPHSSNPLHDGQAEKK